MKKNIFITGLSSVLMQDLAEKINPEKYQLFGLSRQDTPPKLHNVTWLKGSLEAFSLPPAIDILIHGAAITHTFAESDYLYINYECSKNLFDASIKAGVKKIVYISSRTAGLDAGGYGKSKLLAENYLKKCFDDWLIFRPSEVFGGLKKEGIEGLISDVLHKKVVFYPLSDSLLYPIFQEDVINIIYQSVFEANLRNDTITINGERGYTFKKIIDTICAIKQKSVVPIPIPKFCLIILKKILLIFKIKNLIMPDQIDRFFSKKEAVFLDYDFLSFEDYLKQKKP